MHKIKETSIVFLLGTVVVFYLIGSSILFSTSKADSPELNADPTPTPYYVYLPFVSKSTESAIPPDDISNELEIASRINQQRNLNGLPSVGLVSELTQAARRHSRDMADNNLTSHTGSDNSNGGLRMTEAGYNWSSWAEIIGWGWGGDPASMVNWWMNSPSHKAIILTGKYEDFGVGYAINPNSDWGHYWTVNFGVRSTTTTNSASQKVYICEYTVQNEFGGSSLIIHSAEPCQ